MTPSCKVIIIRKIQWRRLNEVNYHGVISLNPDQDVNWILATLSDPKKPLADRTLMLDAAMYYMWDGQGNKRDYVRTLENHVSDHPSLIARIDEFLKPIPANLEIARMEKANQKRRKMAEQQHAKDHASWVSFWKAVAENPHTAFSPDQAGNTAWNLWQAMKRSGQESRASGWNRRFIEQYFNKEVADRLRTTMISIWRSDRPTLRSERPENEKGTFLIRWQLGLAAIAAEAEDPNWARMLSVEEAELATRYAPIELNGFPSWLETLALAHPTALEAVLGPELTSELNETANTNFFPILLHNVSHAASCVSSLFLPRLRSWLDENAHRVRDGEHTIVPTERLRYVVDVLLKYGDNSTHKHICTVAAQKLTVGLDSDFTYVWLPALMRLDPAAGTEQLERGLSGVQPESQGLGVDLISLLFHNLNNQSSVDLSLPEFTPALLLRLVRLAYRYVRPSDDISHERTYSPRARDDAQQGRWSLVSALLNKKGPEGWAAKLEMANDPLLAHFRDRALLIAKEKAAEESDGSSFSEDEVNAFDHNWELLPKTSDELFALLIDRLDDLEDLLLRDDTPRAAWASISDEKVMRREISRELRHASNNVYTVDQEGVTADEKETDIRLRATTSEQQAVIELKLGDGRSGRDLRDTIKEQLVTKYMAPDNCRAGCLLVTVASNHTWKHPDTNRVP